MPTSAPAVLVVLSVKNLMLSPSRSHLLLQLPLPPTPRRSFARSPQCPLAFDRFNLTQGVTLSLVAPSASHSPPNTIVGVSPRAIGCPGTSPPALYVQSNPHGIHSKETSRKEMRRRGPFPQTLRKRRPAKKQGWGMSRPPI